MLAELTAGYQATKAALDITKGIQALKTEAEVNAAIIDIQRLTIEAQHSLMQAQASHTALIGRITELEQEIVRLKDWETERQRYQLRQIDSSAFAYMHKPGMENGEPAHWLCTQCFDSGHRSILQPYEAGGSQRGGAQMRHRCNRCSAVVSVFYRRRPERPYVTDEPA
ncbi:hypothetical protein [Sphingopyxis granuli]|jgi:hypothetical protein|uniref:hypothetical protein n=1 Tax=Sphingopyxis granuli TaxID=267128 RepID=UPI00082CD16F|nr:hypothetical protein [Sphingopyxis granuli]